MAVPLLTIPYASQNNVLSAPINVDIAPNWAGATSFEIASLPPDTVYDSATTSIVGSATTEMLYTVYIRGVNSDGAGEWAPAIYTTTGQITDRTLRGLSTEWQEVHPAGSSAVIFIRQATIAAPGNFSGTGRMLVNDLANDGNASIFSSTELYTQIVLNGGSSTWVRATMPGWEIIVDIAQAP